MYRIRPWLYLGSFVDAVNAPLFAIHQIQMILALVEVHRFPNIEYLYLPVEEGLPVLPEHFRQGVDFLLQARQRACNALVACGAGISRSAVFAIAALHEAEGLDLLAAVRQVRRHNPDALPNARLWDSLCEYYGQPISYLEMIRQAIYERPA